MMIGQGRNANVIQLRELCHSERSEAESKNPRLKGNGSFGALRLLRMTY